jgi:hypothetical protein
MPCRRATHVPTTEDIRGVIAWRRRHASDLLTPEAFDRWLAEVKREARREAFLDVLHVVNSVRDIAAVNRLREADQAGKDEPHAPPYMSFEINTYGPNGFHYSEDHYPDGTSVTSVDDPANPHRAGKDEH